MDGRELEDRITERIAEHQAAVRGEAPEVDAEADTNEETLEETPANEEVSEDAETDTEAVEADEEETPQAAQERLLAGQYKTVEEMERATIEKEAMIRRQADEVGQMRSTIEALQAKTEADIAQLRSESFEPDEEWEEWADGELTSGRTPEEQEMAVLNAIIDAGERGGPAAANYVLDRLHEISPARAVQMHLRLNAFEARANEFSENGAAEVYPDEPPEEVVDGSWEILARRHPDVAEYRSDMGAALLNMPAEVRDRWEQRVRTDPSVGEEFLENLYAAAKSHRLETRLSEREQAAQQAKRERADRAAAEDTVLTADASAVRVTPPRSSRFDRDAVRKEAGLPPLE